MASAKGRPTQAGRRSALCPSGDTVSARRTTLAGERALLCCFRLCCCCCCRATSGRNGRLYWPASSLNWRHRGRQQDGQFAWAAAKWPRAAANWRFRPLFSAHLGRLRSNRRLMDEEGGKLSFLGAFTVAANESGRKFGRQTAPKELGRSKRNCFSPWPPIVGINNCARRWTIIQSRGR